MLKLLTIIGARPQIIKAAAISRVVREKYAGQIEEHILHTGQHYDENMSEVFIRELGIPEPEYNLHVGSGSHGVQTARIIEGVERVLLGERVSELGNERVRGLANEGISELGNEGISELGNEGVSELANEGIRGFDGVIVYGDTNSTLAAAVAAAKINVPVFHIEAGLRSFNMAMPEEQNRIVCDALSSVLFAPTETALRNLSNEGISDSRISELGNIRRFANGKGQKVVLSGDVMYDNALYFSAMADMKSDIIERLGLTYKGFVLATIHRPANTDNPENLKSIFRALADIAASGVDVVLPLHPRTRKRVRELGISELGVSELGISELGVSGLGIRELGVSGLGVSGLGIRELGDEGVGCTVYGVQNERLRIIDPVSFFEIIRLERNARVVLTDSGGVQKEAFFYGTPSVILRPETEWVEIVDAGAGILAGADYERIMAAYKELSGREVKFPPLFGDGKASEKILSEIVKYLR
ncbi:MAG: UDP-N-acetyl glucosamine 2-epimerase [Paludibacteraceae bacterium]|nr:UDP-N-acetyl glucosamine 2-epimerase [Paludibacteraceae bacterium]